MNKIDLSELQKYPFIRRVNKDGTVDSICTSCFLTIGSGNEAELKRMEAQHNCRAPRGG